MIVVLVAIRTRKITTANRDNMRHHRVIRRHHPLGYHSKFTEATLVERDGASQTVLPVRHYRVQLTIVSTSGARLSGGPATRTAVAGFNCFRPTKGSRVS